MLGKCLDDCSLSLCVLHAHRTFAAASLAVQCRASPVLLISNIQMFGLDAEGHQPKLHADICYLTLFGSDAHPPAEHPDSLG